MPKETTYKVRFAGRCTDEFNPHEFDCTFGFGTKTQANAFYDFKRQAEEPDVELTVIEKLFPEKS